jgi:hypothetical protein
MTFGHRINTDADALHGASTHIKRTSVPTMKSIFLLPLCHAKLVPLTTPAIATPGAAIELDFVFFFF